mgnify:FL=1
MSFSKDDPVYAPDGTAGFYVRPADGGHIVCRDWEFSRGEPTLWPVVHSAVEWELMQAEAGLKAAQQRHVRALAAWAGVPDAQR